MDLPSLRRDFLNTMPSVERKGSHAEGQEDLNRLNKEGEKILETVRSPYFRALIGRGDCTPHEIEELTHDLKIRRIERKEDRKRTK